MVARHRGDCQAENGLITCAQAGSQAETPRLVRAELRSGGKLPVRGRRANRLRALRSCALAFCLGKTVA